MTDPKPLSKYTSDSAALRDPDRLVRVGPGVTLLGELMRRSGWTYEQALTAAEIATARYNAERAGATPEQIAQVIAAADRKKKGQT